MDTTASVTTDAILEWRLQGHQAQRRGVGPEACSYAPGSAARTAWLESWQDAADDHAYFEGAEAAQSGAAFMNPYVVGSPDYEDWTEGYREARESGLATR